MVEPVRELHEEDVVGRDVEDAAHVATDAKIESRLPVLNLNDVDAVASFMTSHLRLE